MESRLFRNDALEERSARVLEWADYRNDFAGICGTTRRKSMAGHLRAHCATTLLSLVLQLAQPAVVQGQVHDTAADFSTASNPNGAWSYGWSPKLGGAFYPYLIHDSLWELDFWRDQTDPNVSRNGTAFPIDTGFGIWPANQVAFHPGPRGEFSVVRWTSLWYGMVAVASVFTGLDYNGPTTTDVHVLVNGVPVFNGFVEGFGSSRSFNTNFFVATGDTIDFAVRFGRNRNYGNDTTGLIAIIVTDPPILAIHLVGTNVQISWPVKIGPEFVLQCAPTLSTPVPWQWVTNQPVVIQSDRIVTLPFRSSSHFFRLVRVARALPALNVAPSAGVLFQGNPR